MHWPRKTCIPTWEELTLNFPAWDNGLLHLAPPPNRRASPLYLEKLTPHLTMCLESWLRPSPERSCPSDLDWPTHLPPRHRSRTWSKHAPNICPIFSHRVIIQDTSRLLERNVSRNPPLWYNKANGLELEQQLIRKWTFASQAVWTKVYSSWYSGSRCS